MQYPIRLQPRRTAVSRAYACLSDPEKRANYDRFGHEDQGQLGRRGGGGRGMYAQVNSCWNSALFVQMLGSVQMTISGPMSGLQGTFPGCLLLHMSVHPFCNGTAPADLRLNLSTLQDQFDPDELFNMFFGGGGFGGGFGGGR